MVVDDRCAGGVPVDKIRVTCGASVALSIFRHALGVISSGRA